MADILSLRGRTALSPFRLAKLRTALSAAHPNHGITGLAATFWHFAEVARPLTAGERDTLERLLMGRASKKRQGRHRLPVVPRPGTISPVVEATDILRNCGLAAVSARGAWHRLHDATDGPLRERTRCCR
jgi:phosphoribosylformylglycinamidine synthase